MTHFMTILEENANGMEWMVYFKNIKITWIELIIELIIAVNIAVNYCQILFLPHIYRNSLFVWKCGNNLKTNLS